MEEKYTASLLFQEVCSPDRNQPVKSDGAEFFLRAFVPEIFEIYAEVGGRTQSKT